MLYYDFLYKNEIRPFYTGRIPWDLLGLNSLEPAKYFFLFSPNLSGLTTGKALVSCKTNSRRNAERKYFDLSLRWTQEIIGYF